MAIMVPCKGKEIGPSATITLGQKIGMQVKSSRRNSVLKRKSSDSRRREPSISESMTIGMVRQPAGACLTRVDRLGRFVAGSLGPGEN
jgi:hypothetical protein